MAGGCSEDPYARTQRHCSIQPVPTTSVLVDSLERCAPADVRLADETDRVRPSNEIVPSTSAARVAVNVVMLILQFGSLT
jgi:hypothetical protein